ncbi:MAG TPA: hypothetical protein VL614_14815 [Acetobacteraceae bacterium]|jgi:hypothetical protein|nr:hypothetical protein [Acetobacteraceae bacterium]
MSETTPVQPAAPVAVTTTEGFWAKLYESAARVWHTLVQADAEIVAVDKAHPEIAAAATALEAMAPPNVRMGIETANEVADAVNNIIVHATDAGVPAAMVAAKT